MKRGNKTGAKIFFIVVIMIIIAAAIVLAITLNNNSEKNITGNAAKGCMTECFDNYDIWHCNAGPAQGNLDLCKGEFCACLGRCWGMGPVCEASQVPDPQQ